MDTRYCRIPGTLMPLGKSETRQQAPSQFLLPRDYPQVLPRVLDQITSCRDDLAQLYLMQALIQGFPDRFHLGTLETLLGVLPQLQPGVKVRGSEAGASWGQGQQD